MTALTSQRKLLLSTATLLGALSGYGRGAYAACAGPANNIVCSGTAAMNPNQLTIPEDNAVVSTLPGFGVNTGDTAGIQMTGDGALFFVDTNNSEITGGIRGLAIVNPVDLGGPASITVSVDSVISAAQQGIDARMTTGTGAININLIGDGDVRATDVSNVSAGIRALNTAGTGVGITTGEDTFVSGGQFGIQGRLEGPTGDVRIEANGEVQGTRNDTAAAAIFAFHTGGTASSTTTVITGENSVIDGIANGIIARNTGAGSVVVEANGMVRGRTFDGILAENVDGTDITVTTGENSDIQGGDVGVNVDNRGTGVADVTIDGEVGGTNIGVSAVNGADATDLHITTVEGSSVTAAPATGGTNGITAQNAGTGVLDVNANGYVYGFNSGIATEHTGSGNIDITTGASSNVVASNTVITAMHSGTGSINITTNGDVTGTNNDGISAQHTTGGRININLNYGSTVSSNGAGVNDFGIDTVSGPTTVVVAGTLNGGVGGAARFDQNVALDDRMELHTTAVVNGSVMAGEGIDTLAFAGTGNGTFDLTDIDDTGMATQQYQGFERFVIESATWTMNNTTTADFIVNGGTLKGEGTFGSLTVNNGGTLSPGNSFGTITVNGAFTLNAGAVFEVEVNENNMGDLVVVNGTVNLTGATLRILADPGEYALETDHVIIDNDGNDAVVGTFGTITSNLAFLIPTVLYNGGTGNDVVLRLIRNEVNPCDVAETQNQDATCEAVDPDLIMDQTAAGARAAYDALSGEIHATIAGVLVDDNRYVREAILGRLMQANHTSNGQLSALGAAGPQVASLDQNAMALGYGDKGLAPPPSSPMAFWTAGYGAWGQYDGDGNAATADRDLGGFMSGMDASVGGSWRVGLTTGASFSNVSVDARNSSADAETYYLGAYTGGMVGDFSLRGGGTWAWSEIDTSRAVIFPGFFERQKASYDADTSQIFGEAAYPTTMGGISVEPFVGLAYVSIDTDRFLERGGALASLRGVNSDQNVGYSTLGMRLATTSQWGSMMVVPHLSARWQHAFDDVTPEAALAFATSGNGFTVAGVPLAEDSALIDAGLDFAIGENTTAGVSYSGQFGDGVTDNAVKGRFTWLF